MPSKGTGSEGKRGGASAGPSKATLGDFMGKAMEDMAVADGSHGPKAAQVADVSLLARAAAALRGLPDAEMAAIAGVLDGKIE